MADELKRGIEAFVKHWEAEDLEGYGINRADYRSGFKAGFQARQEECDRMREALEECKKFLHDANPNFTWDSHSNARWMEKVNALLSLPEAPEGGEA